MRCRYNMRAVTIAALVLAAAAFAVVPAAAKDGVHATLTTKVPLDAKPGSRLEVGWRLGYVEEGKRRPFGALGVFVRLRSASGAPDATGFAGEDSGNFVATVVVPRGGIGDVQIGLRGYTSGAYGSGRSDLLFPITNDPLPGVPRAASSPPAPPTREPAEGGTKGWMFVVAAGLLLMIGATALTRRRTLRNTRAATAPSSDARPL
jgi:hypothetical protein